MACCALLGLACAEEDEPLDEAESTGGSAGVVQGVTSEAGAGGSTAQGGSTGSTGSGTSGSGGASEGNGGSSLVTGGSSSTGGSDQGLGGSAGGVSTLPAAGETGVFVGMTAAHNEARQAEMQDLPDLTWSDEIAEFAQEWADELATQCGTLMHRDQDQYGENLATQGTTAASGFYPPEEAVENWVSEKACWSYGTIRGTETCNQTCTDDLNSTGCGHYTQVVWRDTRRVGCGYSTCQSGNFNFEIWVCNYDPPGNYIGEAPY